MKGAPASGPRLSPRVAILDRDGVLIDVVRDERTGSVRPASTPSDVRLLPGVVPALRALRARGHLLAIVSRQPPRTSRAETVRVDDAIVALLAAHGLPIAHRETYFESTPDLLFDVLDALDACPSRALFVSTDLEAARLAGIDGALVFARERLDDVVERLFPLPLRLQESSS